VAIESTATRQENTNMLLENKVAIVTGGGSGVGREIAVAFAREGAQVAVVDINGEAANSTTKELIALGGRSIAVAADVSTAPGVTESIQTTLSTFGRLDVLSNNVGIISRKSVLDCPLEEWQAVFQVNVDSVFLTAKYGIPVMREAGGGSIVNMSSAAALVAAPGRPAYCASKSAVSGLTRQLAVDCAPFGIRVNAVAPSSVEDTGMYQGRPDVRANAREVKRLLFETHPLFKGLGRICQASDVAAAVVFLASDASAMITGVTLPIEGGSTAV
jgi:NAD(P)-dependent dehydrogenase (short-subunit alcohol dehydrogenase family)